MKLKLYQVDAFASNVFEGNPAAVCPLQQWLSDELMQSIAAENNLSGRSRLSARQISARGGDVQCELVGDRVILAGHAVTLMEATLFASEKMQ